MRGIFLPRSQCINTIGAGELTMQTESPEVTAIHCDVCGCCTKVPGYGSQFGLLQARWGYGAVHDGERYQVRLCEACFFLALSHLRQQRRTEHLFDDVPLGDDEHFGRVGRDDYWGDG